jgi:Do/DeqQ family serine protease
MYFKKILKISAIILPLIFTAQSVGASSTTNIFNQEKPSIAVMLKKAMPSVVSVTVEGTQEYKQKFPKELKEMFKDSMPEEQVINKPFKSTGSGVIVDSNNGYIVTNEHVIKNAEHIFVTLHSGNVFEAKVIGSDSNSDIAVLQIKAEEKLNELKIADSNNLEVGDFVVAIGNPFGLSQTATTGIVSALGRSGLGIENLENFIQTDAAINKGNSGGALINWQGELIGINTAIYAPSGGSVGIGFAIPSNMMKSLVEQILEHGEVKRGLLGVIGGNLTGDIAKALNLKISKGAFVREIAEGSAAYDSGVLAGDIIVRIDKTIINSFNELRAVIGSRRAGTKLKLFVFRDNKELELKITLGGADKEEVNAEIFHPALKDVKLHPNEDGGIFVAEIKKGSLAQRIGLKKGDLILEINESEINTIEDLKEEFKNIKRVAVLKVLRGKKNVFLVINK